MIMCRILDGLPLVLYLPRVESWVFNSVQFEDQEEGQSSAATALQKRLQPSLAAAPSRCQAPSANLKDIVSDADIHHVGSSSKRGHWAGFAVPILCHKGVIVYHSQGVLALLSPAVDLPDVVGRVSCQFLS